MQEVVISVDWSCEKSKKKAIKMVSADEDVQSFVVHEENKQLTVTGDMDAVELVKKIRKKFPATQIVYMQSEIPRVAQPPPQLPLPPYGHPYYHPDPYNRGPFYPSNGPPPHPDHYNRAPSAPPYGVYYGN